MGRGGWEAFLAMMKIVCTDTVLGGKELFSFLGTVREISETELSAHHLKDVDLFVTRSNFPISSSLLKNTSLKAIATATSGIDHIDEHYLKEKNIPLFHAKGSNANSVAEYILRALTLFSLKQTWPLQGKTLGLIGYGAVGHAVAKMLSPLGINMLAYDPLIPQEDPCLVPLQKLQEEADILSFHCPLVKEGPHATFHYANETFLKQFQKKILLINTARGRVIKTSAVLEALSKGTVIATIMDVWEGEPDFSPELVQHSFLATPHIAGYSYTARWKGTYDVYEQCCHYFKIPLAVSWKDLKIKWAQSLREKDLQTQEPFRTLLKGSWEEKQWAWLLATYNIEEDDRNLREWCLQSPEKRKEAFRRFRKQYGKRFEHGDYVLFPLQEESIMTHWFNTFHFEVKHGT